MAPLEWEDEIEGWFWLPTRNPSRVRGKLETSWSDGLTLALEEPLGEYGEGEFSRVYGYDMAGRPLVLIDVFTRNRILSTRLPERFLHRLTAQQVLLGTDRPLTRFPKVIAWFRGLPEFMVGSGVDYEASGRIIWDAPNEHRWVLGDDLVLVFKHQRELTGGLRDIRMRDDLRVEMRGKRGRRAGQWQTLIHALNVFLGFCISNPADFERLVLIGHRGQAVENRYGLRKIRGADHGRPWIREWDFQDLGNTLAAWLRYRDESPEAFAMIAEYIAFGGHLNLADRLLLLARFLEVHHRRRHKSGEFTREAHRNRVREVLTASPTEHHDWLKGVLEFSNNITLRQRLVELCAQTRLPRELLNGTRADFAQGVTRTRNYYTHYSSSEKRKAADGLALAVMVKRLWLLARSCMLQEVGFSATEATEAIRHDHEWRWLCEQRPFRS